MLPSLRMALVTVPTVEVGQKIAQTLLSEGLIACCNIIPNLTSIYLWEGKECIDSEALMVLKTVQDRVAELERRLHELHPYKVPEFITLDPDSVSRGYLSWVVESCSSR